MAYYLATDADLTAVADEIRTKGGTSAQLAFPAGFVSAIDAIETGGGVVDPDEIATRAIPSGEVVLDSATSIKSEAFCRCDNMTKISSETVTTIYARAFELCRNLTEVSFPNVTDIGTKNGSYGVTGSVFAGCPKLQKFYFPKLKTITGARCFGQDDAAGGGGVGSSSYPATIALPSITSLANQVFRGTGGYWDAIDLGPGLTAIGSDQFYQGTFQKLILRRTSGVVTAPSADSIKYIYNVWVPSALIASYQTATNWATRYNAGTITFHAIEGSEYEHYYADGTPIT